MLQKYEEKPIYYKETVPPKSKLPNPTKLIQDVDFLNDATKTIYEDENCCVPLKKRIKIAAGKVTLKDCTKGDKNGVYYSLSTWGYISGGGQVE
ncbi:MAG TPA: hypothetical protein VGP72_13005 [Planctomycetota bacterium]|jgi:hypothetical protein